jgi:hypothetical protein
VILLRIRCILSAMSGVAVMPYLLEVEQSLASPDIITTEKAKETLVIAKTACGMDAILAICMAEFCLGFIFGQGITNIDSNVLDGFDEERQDNLRTLLFLLLTKLSLRSNDRSSEYIAAERVRRGCFGWNLGVTLGCWKRISFIRSMDFTNISRIKNKGKRC